jgi:hypothetical protein
VLSHISLGLKTNKTLKFNLKNSSFIVRLKQQTPLITHQLEQKEITDYTLLLILLIKFVISTMRKSIKKQKIAEMNDEIRKSISRTETINDDIKNHHETIR